MNSKRATIATYAGLLMIFAPGQLLAQPIEKKGTTPYVTHFIFRPLMSLDIPGLGKATTLEAVGTTENMKGEKMLDKMSARCVALNVESGPKKYIDGACVLTDRDGDQIFSTFDTRDLDKSQPQMDCGTHIITGGSGKYKGITGSEPFACIAMPALAGPGGYCDGHPAQHHVGNQMNEGAEPSFGAIIRRQTRRGQSLQGQVGGLK